ncbi:hypothetical protein Tco_0048390, partial [Tanacetum coccineum]
MTAETAVTVVLAVVGQQVMVVLAAVEQQPEKRKRRVEESEYDERVDRAKRNTFGFGRNARRKTFPAAATWWPAVREGLPEFHGEEREYMRV